jgi:hypothetical protein
MLVYLVIGGVLALIVLALAAYRRVVASQEDDSIHISEREVAMVSQQEAVAHRLEVIDRWGKVSTVVAVLYGLAIGGVMLYQAWLETSKIPGQ